MLFVFKVSNSNVLQGVIYFEESNFTSSYEMDVSI